MFLTILKICGVSLAITLTICLIVMMIAETIENVKGENKSKEQKNKKKKEKIYYRALNDHD